METPPMEKGTTHPQDFAAAGPQEQLLDSDQAEVDASDGALSQLPGNQTSCSLLQAWPCDAKESPDKNLEPLPAEECTFCPHVSIFMEDYADSLEGQCRRELFHEECPSCASVDIPLCEFCQHLRLPHILMCLPQDTPYEYIEIRPISPIGALNCKECAFCQFLVIAAALPLPEPARTADLFSTLFNIQAWKMKSHLKHSSWVLTVFFTRDGCTDMIDIHQEFPRNNCTKCIEGKTNPLPEPEEFIPWRTVIEWLSNCHCGHRRHSGYKKHSLPSGFRVIDVESKRVVQIPEPDCQFVTLSYVWGPRLQSPPYIEEATCDNIEALQSTGLRKLPKTVEDAISICKHLNKQYIWVDRYCIVQDDNDNKHTQINAMADIFALSDLTIIVCSGESVRCGIPGVKEKRQVKTNRISFNNVELTENPRFHDSTVFKSIWNSRGWTYQEAVLAKKRLFVTPTSVSFDCSETSKGEETLACSPAISMGLYFHLHTIFAQYARHLRAYTSRHLSYDEDVYDAFHGIMRALYHNEFPIHFGIPDLQFDQGLLWLCGDFACQDVKNDDLEHFESGSTHQNNVDDRHTIHSCNSDDRYLRVCKQTTPSWSWGSVRWPTHIDHSDPINVDNFAITLVKWIIYNHDNPGTRWTAINGAMDDTIHWSEWPQWSRWQPNPPDDSGSELHACSPQLAFALAINEGCFEGEIKCSISQEDSFESLETRFTKRWPKYMNAYAELPGIISPKEGPRSDGIIFTRAQSAFLYVDCHWIKNSEGGAIGKLFPDPRLPQVQNLPTEFIALSISTGRGATSRLCRKEESFAEDFGDDDMTYVDCDDRPLEEIPVVNVMLISRKGDIARRVAIGYIFLTQWGKAERSFKDVWLE